VPYRIVVPEVLADACAGGLVARSEVQFTRDGTGRDIERGLFALEVFLL